MSTENVKPTLLLTAAASRFLIEQVVVHSDPNNDAEQATVLNMVAESQGMICGNVGNDPNLLSHKSKTPLGFS